jgi:tetratricopeptide (TPR) repeat protein
MKWLAFLTLAALAASPALSQTCPPPRDISEEMTVLIEAAQAAENPGEGQRISDDMWALWADAPDAAAQEILDSGMRKRSSFDLLGAITEFDRLVTYCPDYAEGYNQRAFAYFLAQDFEAALTDLERAIALSPRHVAALSGKALTLIGLGRTAEAALVLREALALNPWLPERGLLPSLEEVEQEL